jgi:CspA family cold shock protein
MQVITGPGREWMCRYSRKSSMGEQEGVQFMPRGEVKWFNDRKGYGFISQEGGQDIFVHHSGILGEGFRSLAEGDVVEFEIEESDRGPKAVSVQKI